MRRALKWVGYIVGGLIAVIVIAVGTVYAVTSSRMAKTYPTKVQTVAISTDSVSLERGRHLVSAVGKCAACHGDNLAGKMVFAAPVFGKLSSANLTSGKSGIGSSYTDEDYVRAMRYGVGRDGKSLVFMPAEAFNNFNDADLGAMIAYLKTVAPADMPVVPTKFIGPIMRIVYLMGGFALLPAEIVAKRGARPADVAMGVTSEYGGYLVRSGGCTSCHGDNLAGGNKVEGVVTANLTPGGGLGKWSEADFMKAIRMGTRPDGRVLSAVMPWPYMKEVTDDELHAMWMYIHSVPAVAVK